MSHISLRLSSETILIFWSPIRKYQSMTELKLTVHTSKANHSLSRIASPNPGKRAGKAGQWAGIPRTCPNHTQRTYCIKMPPSPGDPTRVELTIHCRSATQYHRYTPSQKALFLGSSSIPSSERRDNVLYGTSWQSWEEMRIQNRLVVLYRRRRRRKVEEADDMPDPNLMYDSKTYRESTDTSQIHNARSNNPIMQTYWWNPRLRGCSWTQWSVAFAKRISDLTTVEQWRSDWRIYDRLEIQPVACELVH